MRNKMKQRKPTRSCVARAVLSWDLLSEMVWAVPSNVRLRVDAARAVFAVFLFFYFANLGHFGIHPYPCGRDSTDFSVPILIQAIPSHGSIFLR
jgi:hypothetical protein